MLKKIKRKVKSVLRPEHVVDYMDAPILRGEEACIPTGNSVAIAPNFRSLRENEPIVAEHLGEATVTGRHGWIRQRGIWMMQFSWYGGQTFLPPSYQVPPQSPPEAQHVHNLDGKAITTLPCFNTVYGHVLIDELPVLLHLLTSGEFEDYDTILASPLAEKLLSRTSHSELNRFMERILTADPNTTYHGHSLSALRRNGCKTNPSRGELDLLRASAKHPDTLNSTPARVFLMRDSAARSIENMEEVNRVLEAHNVTMLSASSHPQPWTLFANASLVIGVAGSDLSDSAFMRPGAALLEIHPSDHVKTYNWNVGQTVGLQYFSIIAPSTLHRSTLVGPGNSAIRVPIDAFGAEVEKAIHNSS